MCLIIFAYKAHSEFPLIIASNRDEFYLRPTEPPHFWKHDPKVLAGLDKKEGGSWLGLSTEGRISFITNFRLPTGVESQTAKSRGHLVRNFLTSTESPQHYLNGIKKDAHDYGGFNLFVGDLDQLLYFSNQSGKIQTINPGIYGISNHLLDTPWPKVVIGKTMFQNCLRQKQDNLVQNLFQILIHQDQPADHELPHTGVKIEWERLLAPIFVKSSDYGTVSSSVILVDSNGIGQFYHREYHGNPSKFESVIYNFSFSRQEE